jgi:hypothetical protein
MEGIALLDLPSGRPAAGRAIAVAEWQDLIYSVSDGEVKYIFNPRGACPVKPPWRAGAGPAAARGFVYDFEEYYDLASDPLEQENLVAGRAAEAAAMRKELESWLAAPARRREFRSGTLTPDERELLEKLGYTAPGAGRKDVRFRDRQ